METKEKQMRDDALEFLEKSDKMNFSDKVELLTNLLSKYTLIEQSEVNLNYKDFFDIISRAKGIFAEDTANVFLEGSRVPLTQNEFTNLCLVRSTIGHLNKLGVFRKVPKIEIKK